MSPAPEAMEPMAQPGWSNMPSVNSTPSSSSKKTRRRRPLHNKLAQGLFLSLPLFASQAAAFSFASSNGTPASEATSLFKVTGFPWRMTSGGSLTDPTSITTVSIPTNTAAIPTYQTPSNLTPIQLIVTNGCGESIWPGILTQNGTGPGIGGFELSPGASRVMSVSADWGGRVWGRTNCSFNGDGSGPGTDGKGTACSTGDCLGRLDCEAPGRAPATLAEFTLQGGSNNNQTFYDISLVDGYNIPLAIIYHPSQNTSWIPPNLTNCACVASAGYLSPSPYSSSSSSYLDSQSDLTTNSTYPMPYEPFQTNTTVQSWCPLSLRQPPAPSYTNPNQAQENNPTLPSTPFLHQDASPIFQPCLSPCSATSNPSDCCTGHFSTPQTCIPSLYSRAAKRVCPDAYSFAFDDRTSTFAVPFSAQGAGWEVRFCPRGARSTDILGTFGEEVRSVGGGGGLSETGRWRVRSRGYIEGVQMGRYQGAAGRQRGGVWGVVVGVVGVVVVLGVV